MQPWERWKPRTIRPAATAADKAFHLAILDATHNPVLQGFRGAIDTILSAVFLVAVDSVDGWFKDNLPNHAATARAIEEGDAKKARNAMEQVLGYTQSKLSNRNGRRRSPGWSAKRPPRSEANVMRHWLSSALWFCAPFAVLLVLWAVLVPYFDVNPRLFPHARPLWSRPASRAIQDGTLDSAHRRQPAARRGRHGAGARGRHSARHRHGRQPGGLELSHAAVPLLLGAGRHRLDPDRDAVVRLRLRRHHVRDLQRRVLHRHLQHAARRLDHSPARCAMPRPRSARGAGRC